MLNFVEKVLWHALDKKDKDACLTLMLDVLENEGWNMADSRPDLWLLGETILHSMGEGARKALTNKIVLENQKYQNFLALVLCCQMVLPLQRHPEAKLLYTEWQGEILKFISESCTD